MGGLAIGIPAGWLILRSKPSVWQVGALVVGFVLLEFCLVLPPALMLAVESLLLVTLAWPKAFGWISASGLTARRT